MSGRRAATTARRTLADLGPGARGRIVEVRLPPGRRFLPESPLQPGADVYVAEAPGGRWLHVRIEFREYSVPIDVAEHVLVEPPADGSAPPRPAATDAYAVLLSRLERRSWRVRIVERAGGAVARSEWFEDPTTPAGAGRRSPATRPSRTPRRSGPATACPERAAGGRPAGR